MMKLCLLKLISVKVWLLVLVGVCLMCGSWLWWFGSGFLFRF